MDPQFPVTFRTGERYRVDKTYIWLGPVAATLLVIFVGGMSSIDGLIRLFIAVRDGLIPLSIPLFIVLAFAAALLIFGVMVLVYVLSYRHMSYAFDEREFSFRSGIFVKKRVHLPYERVQSVNHRASILQRIAGVCTVTVDSAGGSSNKGVRVPYVRLQVAERMRSDFFVRKAAAAAGQSVTYVGEALPLSGNGKTEGADQLSNAFDDTLEPLGSWRGALGGAAYVEEPVVFEFGLTNKQLLLASFTHPGALIGGLIAFVCLIFTTVSLFLADEALPALVMSLSLPVTFGGTVGTWLVSSLGIMVSYGNFKVRRRGTRIEVEHGLLTRTFSGIDIDRIQSIEVRQSLFRRLLGYCELSLGRIDVQTNDKNSKDESLSRGLLIHPFLSVSHLEGILNGLLPEFEDRPRLQDRKPMPPVAKRRELMRRCLWYNWMLWGGLICLAALFGVSVLAANRGVRLAQTQSYYDLFCLVISVTVIICIVVATVVACIGALMWTRESGCAWNRRCLLLHNGGLTTSTSIIPRRKIQSGYARSNPFQRLSGVASITAVTAAGVTNTKARLVDVTAEDARAYLDWLH